MASPRAHFPRGGERLATADDFQVALNPRQWSCDGSIKPTTAQYELQGERPTLATKTGAVIFAAALDVSGTKVNVTTMFGCYGTDGEFEAHELHEI